MTIPMRDFFRHPERAHYRISPDGVTLAFMQPWERRMNIFVQPSSGGDALQITSERDRDIPGYFWKGPDRLVYTRDVGGDENDHVVVVDRRGGDSRDLTPFADVKAVIVDALDEFPDRLLVGLNRRLPEVFDVYDLDLTSGTLTLVAENPGAITSWGADHAGTIRYAIATDGVDNTYLYRDGGAGAFREVLTTSFRDAFVPQFFTADNRRLYAASNLGRDKIAIVLVDPSTAREEEIVYARDDVDLAGLAWSKARRRASFVAYQTARNERHFLDPDASSLFAALEAKLPGYEVTIQSTTDDEMRMIVAASNDRTQGARYFYDRASDQLTLLGEVTPWLPEASMAAMSPITYPARDGLAIHGYLTLPNDRPPGALPVVIN
ncbi:MAG: S9 family peptidase, partial [Casimicrobiaceae bacterium]